MKPTDSHRTLAEDKVDKKAAGDKKRGKIKTSAKQERYRTFATAFTNIADSTTYGNAFQSALRAGYSPGYARGDAHKLLANPGIQAEIEAIRAAAAENPKICTANEVLEMLSLQARTLINKLFDPRTKAHITPADMTDTQAQALSGYRVVQRIVPGHGEDAEAEIEIRYEFKLVDRQVALEKLARWHGLFEKNNKQKVPTVPQALVAFPTGTLTLEAWQEQAIKILDAKDKAKAIP